MLHHHYMKKAKLHENLEFRFFAAILKKMLSPTMRIIKTSCRSPKKMIRTRLKRRY